MHILLPAASPVFPLALFKQQVAEPIRLQGRKAALYYQTDRHRIYLLGEDNETDRVVMVYRCEPGGWFLLAWHPAVIRVSHPILSFYEGISAIPDRKLTAQTRLLKVEQ